ncbi:shTK domain protein [Ancylostoma duodenale]|uniref:ShTK domain protein n=1 Tax=Ancylostoma duodenale TaxID=51022 RepID=A0A0C2H1Q1_9BILA|nr:shTK domain protein [Ancylostoma duodenale]
MVSQRIFVLLVPLWLLPRAHASDEAGYCIDQVNPWTRVSDCQANKHLCNHPQYYAFMSAQCPKTCKRCKDEVQPTHPPNPAPNPGPSNCVDLVNPWTRVSDCPRLRHLCNHPHYIRLMNVQCRKTCNRCSDTVQPTHAPNPTTNPNPSSELTR